MFVWGWDRGEPGVKNIVIAVAVVITLVVLISQASCVRLPHVDPQYRWAEQQRAAAVHVEVICGDKAARGNGVVISERHVLTAHHVVACEEIPIVHVTLGNSDRHKVVVTKERPNQDIARLELMHAGSFGLHIAPPILAQPWRPNENDWVCAVPYGKNEVCGLRVTPNMFGNRMAKGDSGAGVYDYGALVGLVVKDYPSANTTLLTLVTSDWLEGT